MRTQLAISPTRIRPYGFETQLHLKISDISSFPTFHDVDTKEAEHDENPRNGCHERACGHPPLASSGGRGGLTSGAGSITEEASRVYGSASALQSGVSAHKSHNGDSPRPKPARNRGLVAPKKQQI